MGTEFVMSSVNWSSSGGNLVGSWDNSTLNCLYTDGRGHEWKVLCPGVLEILAVKHCLRVETVKGEQELVSGTDIVCRRPEDPVPTVPAEHLPHRLSFATQVEWLSDLLKKHWHARSVDLVARRAEWSCRGWLLVLCVEHSGADEGLLVLKLYVDTYGVDEYRGDNFIAYALVDTNSPCPAAVKMLTFI